jgi:hypothetical protein
MMKLNGVIYLTYDEVIKIVDSQLSRFSTSEKAKLPLDIKFVDAELIRDLIEDAVKYKLRLFKIYRGEEYMRVKGICNYFLGEQFPREDVSETYDFLSPKNYTTSEIKTRRTRYYKFLTNILVHECIDILLKM